MARARLGFGRYRGVIYWVLLILTCLSARRVIVWYRTRPAGRIHVYDLTWSEKREEGGDVVYRRWRYFIEAKTNLPRKVEKYSRGDPNDNYVLEETLIVNYPTDEQIRQVINDVGF